MLKDRKLTQREVDYLYVFYRDNHLKFGFKHIKHLSIELNLSKTRIIYWLELAGTRPYWEYIGLIKPLGWKEEIIPRYYFN